MKSPHFLYAIVAFVCFCIPNLSQAQLAASGTPGDHAVYTLAGGGTLGTGLGTSIVHPFATGPIADTADSFNATGTGVVELTAGHHLVIYGVRYQNTGGARAATESAVKINGTASYYGLSASYMRDTIANNGFVRGGTIVEVAQGDTLEIESERTDNHSQTINRLDADLQLVKLDDALDYIRLGGATNATHMPANDEGPAVVTYDVQDEVDGGSFSHTSNSGAVTLLNTGNYLVFANTGYRATGGTQRQAITQRVTLNGAIVEDSSTMVYLRHAAAADGAGGLIDHGAGSLGMIVEATAGDVLQVESVRDNDNSSAVISVEAARTGLTILALPGYGEYVTLSGPLQDVDFPQADPETTLDLSDSSAVANASFNYPGTGNDVTVNKTDAYLFLASHYCEDEHPNNDRQSVRQGFVASPGSNVIYGHGGSYHRGDDLGADRAIDSGDWAGAVLALNAGDVVGTSVGRYGSTPTTPSLFADSVGLQALNITSISAAPLDPVVAVNNGLAVLTGSVGTVIDAAVLETLDDNDPPANLTYTLLNTPTGGTLRLSGTALDVVAPNNTFTQADVNAGLLTFDAGAVAGTGFGFDFEVLDVNPGSSEAEGMFVINVGVTAMLVDDTSFTDEDEVLTVVDPANTSLFDNDTGTALIVTAFDGTSALGAAVTVATDGTFSYDPQVSATIQALDDGDSASDSFTYTASDFSNTFNTATVTISLTGLNDTPVALADAWQTSAKSLVGGNLLTNDSDVDAADVLSVTSFDGGTLGTITTAKGAEVTIDAFGNFSYNPCPSAVFAALAPGASDTETFSYEVSDGTTPATAMVTVTVFGEYGAATDIANVPANGAGSTVNVDVFDNDTAGGAAGTPTASAVISLNAADAGNSDGTWQNLGSGGNAVTMAGAGTESVLSTALTNPPVGLSAAYSLSGSGSGALLPDADTVVGTPYLYGSNMTTASFTVEAAFRPADHNSDNPIWSSGGNGTGSSLVLLGDQIIFTVGNGSLVAQASATIPAGAIAGGDFVHIVATFDITSDIASIYANNVLTDQHTAINITNGAIANIADWSGTDDGGIGRVAGTTGGDVAVSPFLGAFGTIDLPNDFAGGADRFAGEIALVRHYASALTAAEVEVNFESVFGVIGSPVFGVAGLMDVAGAGVPVAGQMINLPSGAIVTVEADGTLTYDPNGAFDAVAVGNTALDSFTYTLANAGGVNATATVKIIIDGTNTSTQIEIAADQTNAAEGTVAGFTLTASAPVFGATTVDLAYSGTTTGGDFFTTPASVTIAGGATTGSLSLSALADSVFEGAENVIVTITGVSGANVIGASASASTIIDDVDAPPVYSIASASPFTTEGNDATFTISSPSAAATPVTITLASSGTAGSLDGLLPPTTFTIPANANSADFDVVVFDDGHADPGETLAFTISAPSVGSVAGSSASTLLVDGSASGLFLADFEGVTIAPPTGANANAAANEGTATGTWVGVPSATTTGEIPGVIAETGADVKGDGFDFALRVDRPTTPAEGMMDAVFADAMELSANDGLFAFDISSRRTLATDDKNTVITGYDSVGNASFRLIVSGNNTAGSGVDERLLHDDGAGTITPLGNANDLANSNGNDEDDLTRVTLLLSPAGYQVAIDVEPIDGVPESISSLLPYAGSATQISRVEFAVAGSTDDNFNAGIVLDDICASGVIANTPPVLALAGTDLPNGGATPLMTMFTGGSLSFSAFGANQLSVADADANGGIESVRLQSVSGLGSISVNLNGAASITAGSNGSSDVTVSGTIADLNATLAGIVTYTAGAAGGMETLRITASDGGNTGAPGVQTSSHDFTFAITANPTVIVDQAAAQSDPTVDSAIDFIAIFSEAVDNFDATDIDFTGSTNPGSLTATVSGGPVSWAISVTGAGDCDEVVVSLPMGAANRAGTADPSEASLSTDNSVTYIANLPPTITNLAQDLALTTSPTPIVPMVVTDGNGSAITNSGVTAATFNWLNGDVNPTPGDPADHSLGFTLELEYTPDAADLVAGTTVTVYETGGTSNGHGVYLIDGVPYFICKMNTLATNVPSGLLDTDWDSGSADGTISVPLLGSALPAGSPATFALIFGLDTVTYSANGNTPQTVALTNVGTRFNWSGDDTVSISAFGGGPGGLSSTAGVYGDTTDVLPVGPIASVNFWRASDADFSIKALGEEIINVTITVLQSGAGSLTTTGSATFAGDVWSMTDTLSAVNIALANLDFVPALGAPDFVELQVLIDDGDEDSSFPPEGEITFTRSMTSILEDWRVANGYAINGSGPGEGDLDVSAPNAMTNLENFALGFDAGATGDTETLAIDVAGGTITSLGVPNVVQDPNDGLYYFQFTRRADFAAAGLTLAHQFSHDLILWEAAAAPNPVVVATGTGDDGVAIEGLRIELPAALPSGAQAFFARLVVTLIP